jgi:ATP-dependent DNA helicase UvrD/PcrA
MGITREQVDAATKRQYDAAHDTSSQVRLIAGPGSGKSYSIQERVNWLLARGVNPDSIFVISFTRASTLDLRNRIIQSCQGADLEKKQQVNISTLHSLALRALRAAGQLGYPTDPMVASKWEQKYIFDIEFSKKSGYSAYTPSRCKEIRMAYEALCGTGQTNPRNYLPPESPIKSEERDEYRRFHQERTQTYSCVLPGEIVRKCVVSMKAGNLEPARLLNIQQLIIDEYQDLNPMDLEFVDQIILSGVPTFVAGDDDQSIYSFRFANPEGIQLFEERFPEVGDHELIHCFRCSSEVLNAAQKLLEEYSEPNRITKSLISLYSESNPPVTGRVYRWKFKRFRTEARAIAESCKILIQKGIRANKIMILVSNTRALLSTLTQELKKTEVDFETPKTEGFLESDSGKFVQALLRIICNSNDYIAHRILLGLRQGVGPGTCNSIAQKVAINNLNYHDLFYWPLIQDVFSVRETSALNHAREICQQISKWASEETLGAHLNAISTIVERYFGETAVTQWRESVVDLPQEIRIEELRDYYQARTDEQQESLLKNVYERLGIPIPDEGLLPAKVRIMTMHGAKGLNAQIVFIPGLMEDVLPGAKKRPYTGLVFEAARMLYVSITRARVACILSYSTSRIAKGDFVRQVASRFTNHTGGRFIQCDSGLQNEDVEDIFQQVQNL